ncbi:HAD family hydrolase [Cohnella terricola]|uniref:HAD family phosphatase n=1 Tax=Cohnella terricola TaxID=1289167 RepID=A0A559J994_9BACL|nr:HAD family phosphatase [Cohnella terricola]TVX96454.1 HAD family phosphatase [Cohnella terricola]
MAELVAGKSSFPIEGILFDKDGTLLDFVSMWGTWSCHLLQAFSQRLTERQGNWGGADLYALWGIALDRNGLAIGYDRNGPLAMGTIGELISILASQGYASGLSWADAKRMAYECKQLADAAMERERPVKPMAGVLSFLEACRQRNLRLAVVTADETEMALRHLEWLNIRHYFHEVIGTDQVEKGKPFPDMVELACRKLNLDCSQVAVIGDTNGDMMMAHAARAAVGIGIIDTAQTDGKRLLEAADVIVTSYDELSFGRS